MLAGATCGEGVTWAEAGLGALGGAKEGIPGECKATREYFAAAAS